MERRASIEGRREQMCVSVAMGMFYGNVLTTVGPFGKLLSNHDVDLLYSFLKRSLSLARSLHPRYTLLSLSFHFLFVSFRVLVTLFSLSLFHVLLPRCLASLVRSTACFNRSLGDLRSVTVARFRRTCAAASAMMAREKIPESMPWLRHPHTPSATPNA